MICTNDVAGFIKFHLIEWLPLDRPCFPISNLHQLMVGVHPPPPFYGESPEVTFTIPLRIDTQGRHNITLSKTRKSSEVKMEGRVLLTREPSISSDPNDRKLIISTRSKIIYLWKIVSIWGWRHKTNPDLNEKLFKPKTKRK